MSGNSAFVALSGFLLCLFIIGTMSLILHRFFKRLRSIEEARWGKKTYVSSTSDMNEGSRWRRKAAQKQPKKPAEK
jgi:hypothetical protein